jgi:hypothetical protein
LHARGDIPVDVPNIVMGLVFAQVGQLQARTSEQGFVIALQQAVVGSSIVEVELNPVLATTTSAIAVDALLIEETK